MIKKEIQKIISKKTKHTRKPEINEKLLWVLFQQFSKDNGYILTQDNEKVVKTIVRYFLTDPKYNRYKLIKSEPSLNKGLLIWGPNGVGKTYLFEIIQDIGRELFMRFNYNGLWFSKISCGSFVDDYMREVTNDESTFELRNYYKGVLYIDDLGFEKRAFNKTEIIGDILFEREKLGSRTFITTNLKPSEITERYGDRIGDRLPAMFNIINWKGKSFRK